VKVVCITPDDLSTIIFCKTLSRLLHEQGGFEVYTISPVDMYEKELSEINTTHIRVSMERYLSPRKDLKYLWTLYRVLRKGGFDAVITFTTKPNVYGAIAARLAGIKNITIAIRGLGRVFNEAQSAKDSVTRFIVSRLYTAACKASSRVWFTNKNDLRYFVEKSIVQQEKTFLTKNAVDLTEFSKGAVSQARLEALRRELAIGADERIVIMVARMIWPKGIREFAEAAQILKDRIPVVRFLLVAPLECDSPQAVPEAFVREVEAETNLKWLGFRKDVRNLYALADLSVLPSYYKEGGYPRALLEPMALEKPVIAADTEDCKNPVEHGRNGFIVPIRDSQALADAIDNIFSDDNRRLEFGRYSYEKVLAEFDDRVVVKEMLHQSGIRDKKTA